MSATGNGFAEAFGAGHGSRGALGVSRTTDLLYGTHSRPARRDEQAELQARVYAAVVAGVGGEGIVRMGAVKQALSAALDGYTLAPKDES